MQLRKFFPFAEKMHPGATAIRCWFSARAASSVVSSPESNSIHKTNPPCGRETLMVGRKIACNRAAEELQLVGEKRSNFPEMRVVGAVLQEFSNCQSE